MKKQFKNFVVLALMLVTMTSMAHEPSISLTPSKSAKSVVLKLDAKSKNFEIKLSDENLETIYVENIMEGTYAKEFDFNELKNGTYYLSIENPTKSIVYTLSMKAGKVKIEHRKETSNKAVFRVVDDKVYVNVLNHDRQNVDIRIKDSESRILYEENLGGDFKVGKIINFENAVKGRYTVAVKEGDEVYYQNIQIN